MRITLFSLLSLMAATAAVIPDEFPNPLDFLTNVKTSAPITFALSNSLGSNMILQRAPQSALVWGFAPAGAIIKTTFLGRSYSSTSDATDIWRQALPPQPATTTPTTISFTSSTGEPSITITNVLFGDLYLCGGQSNMVFSVPSMTNASAEIQRANDYPNIRIFTVGQKTSSKTPLSNLVTIEEPWSVVTNLTVNSRSEFGYFSAVCFVFGREVYDGLNGKVPIGLVSSSWGGTKIEHWADPAAFKRCNQASDDSVLYNAMIHPFDIGPMAITGFAWYQGETQFLLPPPPSPLFPLSHTSLSSPSPTLTTHPNTL